MTKDKNVWNKVIKTSEICTSQGSVDVLLPWCLSMHGAKLLCNKYRGQMTIITSLELEGKLFSSIEGISDRIKCLREDTVWTGFSDEKVEGNFVDANEGIPLGNMTDYIPLHLSQPNGGREENCVQSYKNDQNETYWFDTNCQRKKIPFFCRVDNNPRIQIRGECQNVLESLSII